MKVEAYQCKHCGSLYATQGPQKRCQTKCLKRVRAEDKARKEAAQKLALSDEIRLKVTSIHEIPELLEKFVAKNFKRTLNITRWELRFEPNMAATHDAPIGKKSSMRDYNHYAGWRGKVEGTTDLYNKPVKFGNSSFDEVRGFGDLFDGFGKRFVRGIHTGTGSGGDKFQYEVRIYVDDFPKLKKMYKTYLPLQEQKIGIIEKKKKLIETANLEVVAKDKRMLELDAISKILAIKLKEVGTAKETTRQEIVNSQKFKDATKVDMPFDEDLYSSVSGPFR